MTADDSEKGIIQHFADGAVPGTFVGTCVAVSRHYLTTQTALPEAAANQSKLVSSKAALQAVRPKPIPVALTTIAAYSAITGLFTGTSGVVSNLRGKDDYWNNTIGGVIAGSVVGLRSGSLYASAGASAALGASALMLGLLGGTFGSMGDVTVERRKEIYRP